MDPSDTGIRLFDTRALSYEKIPGHRAELRTRQHRSAEVPRGRGWYWPSRAGVAWQFVATGSDSRERIAGKIIAALSAAGAIAFITHVTR